MKRWGFCKLRIASTTGQCDFKSKDRHYFKRHTDEEENLKSHITSAHEEKKLDECEHCHKRFDEEENLTNS